MEKKKGIENLKKIFAFGAEFMDVITKGIKDKDWMAMSELVELIQDDLFGFCFYLSANKSVAEDICQEVLIKVLTKIQELKKF